MGEVESRLVKQSMSQPRAYHGTDGHIAEEPVDLGPRQPVALEDAPAYLVRRQQAEREEDPIPPDAERPQLDQHGVHVPHQPIVRGNPHREHGVTIRC